MLSTTQAYLLSGEQAPASIHKQGIVQLDISEDMPQE